VPDNIYQALPKRAKKNGNSVAAEVLAILRQSVATEAELKRRGEFCEPKAEFRARPPLTPRPFASARR
jgi:hypothetical protein